MVELAQSYHELEKCAEDILYVIKPTEDDRNKRLNAVQEIVNSKYLVGDLEDAAVKPFGSFVSDLYAKSGDLDISVELLNKFGFPTSKEKKLKVLRQLMVALDIEGVARELNFIPTARVPVLKYVSKHFGIPCDISIDNYAGRIKSKVLYWISTMDERFRDMVLLVKEWAKAQNINDPKNGTLNSYSLCLLVLFHFQTCKPAILPPMKDIFDLNISEGCGRFNEKNLDQYCVENITKFQRQDRGQKNESPLSHLLATFFEKFCHILVRSSDHRISTYTGQLKRIQGNLFSMTKSYCLFVEDPFQTSDNAARTVDVAELQRITRAFTQAKYMISDRRASRNELLSLLCTPEVSSELGAGATAGRRTNPATSPQQHRSTGYVGYVAANPYGNRYDQRARGTTGSIPVHNPANRHAGTTRAVGGRLQNGSTSNSRPQASSSSAWQW